MVVNYAEKPGQAEWMSETKLQSSNNKIELLEVKDNPLICFKDPKLLKPHPVSAALYLDCLTPGQMLTPLEACNEITEHMDISDLIDSISRDGILVPLVINKNDFIISGSRRWKVAMILGLTTVPVEVKIFPNENEEKQAILDYNRYRVKTFSQRMKEAQMYKEIAGKLAVKRMLAGKRNPAPVQGSTHIGKTNTIVAAKIDMGKETFRKAENIFQHAEQGDQTAVQLVRDIDNGLITVNRAFIKLNRNSSEDSISGPRRPEPVGEGHIVTCPQCNKRYRIYHLQNGKHKFLEMGDSETG